MGLLPRALLLLQYQHQVLELLDPPLHGIHQHRGFVLLERHLDQLGCLLLEILLHRHQLLAIPSLHFPPGLPTEHAPTRFCELESLLKPFDFGVSLAEQSLLLVLQL